MLKIIRFLSLSASFFKSNTAGKIHENAPCSMCLGSFRHLAHVFHHFQFPIVDFLIDFNSFQLS